MAWVDTDIYRRELTYNQDGDTWNELSGTDIVAAIKSEAPGRKMQYAEGTRSGDLGSIVVGGITYRFLMEDNPGMGADYFCVKRSVQDDAETTLLETDQKVTDLVSAIVDRMMSEAENS